MERFIPSRNALTMKSIKKMKRQRNSMASKTPQGASDLLAGGSELQLRDEGRSKKARIRTVKIVNPKTH
jgi:hypothetical protein